MSSLSNKDEMICKAVALQLRRIGDDFNKKMIGGKTSSSSLSSKSSSGGFGKSLGSLGKSSSYGKSTSILNSKRK